VSKMTIVVTKAAYERYCAMNRNADLNEAEVEDLLQDAYDRGEGGWLEWMGKPAVYLHHTYWECEVSQRTQELTLIGCYGMIQSFGPVRAGAADRRNRPA